MRARGLPSRRTSSRVASDVGADVAEGRFDEQHRGVGREDRRVGRRDLADQRALRGVAFAAQDLAHDELALLFAMAATPDEIGEALGDEARCEEVAAFVGVDVVALRGDDVGHGPHRDRVQLDLLREVGAAGELADEDREVGVVRRAKLRDFIGPRLFDELRVRRALALEDRAVRERAVQDAVGRVRAAEVRGWLARPAPGGVRSRLRDLAAVRVRCDGAILYSSLQRHKVILRVTSRCRPLILSRQRQKSSSPLP